MTTTIYRTNRRRFWVESGIVALFVGAFSYYIGQDRGAGTIPALVFSMGLACCCLGYYVWRYFRHAEGQIVVHDDWIGLDRGKHGRARLRWSSITGASQITDAGMCWVLKSDDEELRLRDDGISMTQWVELSEVIQNRMAEAGVAVDLDAMGHLMNLGADDDDGDDDDDLSFDEELAEDEDPELAEMGLQALVNRAIQDQDLAQVRITLDRLVKLQPEDEARYDRVVPLLAALDRQEYREAFFDLKYVDTSTQTDFGETFGQLLGSMLEEAGEPLLAADALDWSFTVADEAHRAALLKSSNVDEEDLDDRVAERLREHYERAVTEHPEDLELQGRVARLRYLTDDLEGALEAALEARKSGAADEALELLLANIYSESDQQSEALAVLSTAGRFLQSESVLYARARLEMESGEPDAAVKSFRAGLARTPDSLFHWQEFVELLRDADRPKDLAEALGKTLELEDDGDEKKKVRRELKKLKKSLR